MSFFKELKRRNVFRVGIAYTVATWLLIQVTDTVFPRIGLPDSAVTLVIALLVIGFIPALILAWAFEMTPGRYQAGEGYRPRKVYHADYRTQVGQGHYRNIDNRPRLLRIRQIQHPGPCPANGRNYRPGSTFKS